VQAQHRAQLELPPLRCNGILVCLELSRLVGGRPTGRVIRR
jgi:hypothetical protein